jgi:hypothetical protein
MGGPYIAIYTKLYGHEARLVYAEASWKAAGRSRHGSI